MSDSSNQKRPETANLRARRQALGLTRAQLAVTVKCSITSLYYIEEGVTRRGVTLTKIDRALTELEENAA